jgi:cellulose synthase/poly-beta-1,6-N-acetylglucosamine synthase-like glycosyltransferase
MKKGVLFVSIIVPCYNEEKNVGRCVDSVLACEYENLEVIVVDDFSTDNTGDILEGYAKRGLLRYIRRSERGGTVKSINTGARASSGSIIGIVPADSYVDKDWVRKAVEHFSQGGHIIAVGGPLKSTQSGYWNRCGELLDDYLLNAGAEVAALPGANMFIRSDVLSALGFFDEGIEVGEDFDMNIRLRAYAKKSAGELVFDDQLKVYTAYPSSLADEARRRFRWGIGRARALMKNRDISLKAWARTLYTPLLLGLSFLVVVSNQLASFLHWITVFVLVLVVLSPVSILLAALIYGSRRQQKNRTRRFEVVGMILLAYTRLVFGSLGSVWGLIRH